MNQSFASDTSIIDVDSQVCTHRRKVDARFKIDLLHEIDRASPLWTSPASSYNRDSLSLVIRAKKKSFYLPSNGRLISTYFLAHVASFHHRKQRSAQQRIAMCPCLRKVNIFTSILSIMPHWEECTRLLNLRGILSSDTRSHPVISRDENRTLREATSARCPMGLVYFHGKDTCA